ncbi:methyltransferase domain-containing protein [Planctomycetota bacterium]
MSTITPTTRELLCCPDCKGELETAAERLVCPDCSRHYDVVEGKPHLFPADRVLPENDGVALSGPDKPTWEYFGLESIIPEAPHPQARALDVGCGPGSASRLLERGYSVTGFDAYPDEHMDVVGDAHSPPFKDGLFALVSAMSVFEHLSDPWKACREMHRVLQPGGYLACSLSFLEPFHGQSYHHFSHLGARRLLETSGFEVMLLEPLGFTYAEACQRLLVPLPPLPRVSGVAVRMLLALRRVGIQLVAWHYKGRHDGKHQRALTYLEEDRYRFEGGFKLVGLKR